MKKPERAKLMVQRLDELYPETPVPLGHSEPFTLLIAVLLSAQCTDKKVNELTPALFQAATLPLLEAFSAKGLRIAKGEILGGGRSPPPASGAGVSPCDYGTGGVGSGNTSRAWLGESALANTLWNPPALGLRPTAESPGRWRRSRRPLG